MLPKVLAQGCRCLPPNRVGDLVNAIPATLKTPLRCQQT